VSCPACWPIVAGHGREPSQLRGWAVDVAVLDPAARVPTRSVDVAVLDPVARAATRSVDVAVLDPVVYPRGPKMSLRSIQKPVYDIRLFRHPRGLSLSSTPDQG
jgi:hypothetical protein